MIKVLIVDDSALIRRLMTEILSADPEIDVVGTAPDPHVAREKIKQFNPDVVTLDVEMPRMDGLSFLEKIMRLRPMPVVMVSALTQKGAEVTVQSLEMGAVDVIAKPTLDIERSWPAVSGEIIEKVKAAARSRVYGIGGKPAGAPTVAATATALQFKGSNQVIAIGASTGGVMALKEIIFHMPADAPPILISQHLPETFVKQFAARMNNNSKLQIVEATQNAKVIPGHVYISPGDRNLTLARSGAQFVCSLIDPKPGSGITPSVDALFSSVAKSAGKNAIGIILTGMGRDGAAGLLEMRQAGAMTIGQSEASCMIYGMPRAAFENGAVRTQMALEDIADFLRQIAQKQSRGLVGAMS
jgi:two-component system chemotaxis response regulator CheB